MYSFDSKKAFEKRLKALSEMSPAEKRKIAEFMDKAADRKDEIDLLKLGDVLVSEGWEGVHRPDMFI